MPRPLNILITGSAFFVFFVGAFLISWVVMPLLGLSFDPEVRRRRRQRLARYSTRFFVRYMERMGLIDVFWSPLPANFPEGRAFMMIANHPTLIDTTVIMARFRDLSTVVSRKWFDRPSLGRMLAAAGYVAGSNPDEEDGTPVLDMMVETLRGGAPMLIFPEGTRSDPERLLRFRRGAVEAAIRAGVPIVPLFIHVNQPMLQRGQRWYNSVRGKGRYDLEFWPVIETAGADLDPRELNAELHARYKARFARMLAERAQPAALQSASDSASPG